ncbi:CorA family divalent cation transporter [Microbacterium sp. NPDC057407]|uniref:CorA family divalent cation transporter n=1 Tax=Microbacterium sp. NPDC057407 TaxID=3346120 RepID=UPI003671DD67
MRENPHDPPGERGSTDAAAEVIRIFEVSARGVDPLEGGSLDDVPGLLGARGDEDRFVWLHILEPVERTIDRTRTMLGIHPTAVTDVLSRLQQPKVQTFDEQLSVMLWNVLHRPDDTLVLGDTFLYIGDGWLLTVQRANGGDLVDLPELLGGAASGCPSDTMPAAHLIMAQIVDGYAQAAAKVESALEHLEEQVFREEGGEDHRRIYRVRKDIGRIDRAVSSITASLNESTHHLDSITVGHERILPYLHDLLDDAAGTAALISNQSRAVDAILSSYEHAVTARQNQDMRTISAFAALLAVPTVIAGLYGTNFDDVPLMQWQYGWAAIIGAIIAIDAVLWVLFKKRGWL